MEVSRIPGSQSLFVMLKRVALGAGVLGVAGTAAGYYRYQKRLTSNAVITAEKYHEDQKETIGEALRSKENFDALPKTLYQYTTCPFCCKLKTFLDYHGVDYDVVEVNPLSKKQVSTHGYGKVPQLRLGDDGPIIVDSGEIVALLKPILDKEAPEITPEEQKWKDWASTTLVRYMVLNTNRTLSESREGYDYVSNIVNFTGTDKVILEIFGGPIMYLVSQYAIKPKLKRTAGYDGGDVRDALYKELNGWVEEGLGEKKFHGGDRPDLADLDVYGVVHSQRFLPVFKDLQENLDARFACWISDMDSLMPPHYKY